MKTTRYAQIPAETERMTNLVTTAALAVHRSLGPGLLESIYEKCLCHELRKSGALVESQIQVPVFYDGISMNAEYRADIIVGGCVLVEVKAVEALLPVHGAQLLTYLKLTKLRAGLLVNFNVPLIRDGIKRMVL